MNVFEYGAICEKNWEMNLAEMNGYKRKYTFYSDFSIAEYCEVYKRDTNAVKNTYRRVEKSWGSSIEAMTEVVMVLNHKMFSFYNKVDSKYMGCSEEWRKKFISIYQELFEKCTNFIYKQREKRVYNEKDMSYYYQVTD